MRLALVNAATVFFYAATVSGANAAGTDYPTKPIRVITGNPGATADILARQVARRLTGRWGQQIVVDNRGGAGATIAAEIAARASPDGYTLLMGQLNSHAIAVSLHARLSYDPLKDFAPITLVASAPQVLVQNRAIPATNWQQLADYIKSREGRINYASAGHGTASHLTAELLKQRTGIDLLHVNYKGGSAALTGILGGEAHAGFVPLATAWPMVQSGKIVAVGISSMTRFPTLPQVPTLHESGVPHFVAASWFGMFAPSHTSKALIVRLNQALVGILRSPPVQRDLLNIGAEASPGTPAEFGTFLKSEIDKWRTVIQTAGIRPQS